MFYYIYNNILINQSQFNMAFSKVNNYTFTTTHQPLVWIQERPFNHKMFMSKESLKKPAIVFLDIKKLLTLLAIRFC